LTDSFGVCSNAAMRYAICRRDGSLLSQEQGVPFTFTTMAEARGWCLAGEKIVPAPVSAARR